MSGVGMERQHKPRHFKIVYGRLDVVRAALPPDFLDAPALGFDVARTEKRIGQKRIGRAGRMLAKQALHRPSRRQVSGIPQDDLAVIHADLDRDAAAWSMTIISPRALRSVFGF